MSKWHVSAQRSAFWGQDDGWRHMGKIFPKNSPKRGVNRQFQAKMPKSLHCNISGTINRRTSDLRTEFRPWKALRGWSAITPKQIQHGWRPPSWKSIWRHISVADVPIWTKFGSRMQNDLPITGKWSRWKPEVEFQYGGRLYFETGSSYISAANWNISTKFGLLIDFDLLKAVTSTNTKPGVVFSRRGRHLEKWIWRHISAVGASIWTKFGSLMQSNVRILDKWLKSKQKVDFQYGWRFFSKTEVVISQPSIEICRRNLVCWQTLTFSRQWRQQVWNRNWYFAVAAAILKNGNDVIFLQWVLRNSVAWCRMTWKLREVVEIKTGSRIPIWRTFVFQNRK